MQGTKLGLIAALLLYSGTACNKNGLRGVGNVASTESPAAEKPIPSVPAEEAAATQTSEINTPVIVENISEMTIASDFKGGFESKALVANQENHIWVATAAGDVHHLRLEKGAIKSRKIWTEATPASGTRTYVLEGGAALLAKNGGHLYFLHDGVTEGAIDKTPAKGNYFRLSGVADTERSCVVSYRKNGKRMLGIGYGLGMFVEIEQDDQAPFAPKFASVTVPVQISTVQWGYSCYIDQTRLQYYGQYYQGTTIGIDLKTMTALDLAKAPNKTFVSTNLPSLTIGPNAVGNGSYAMSGDRLGNVFNASNFYTLALEPQHSMVWGSAGTNLSVYPHECLYKTAECKGFATYGMMESIGAQVGPLSALGDGYMVGMVRGVGDVYLIKLKIAGNATGGIEAVKIAERVGNGGDPYMYTDFTGATLYLTSSLNEFDFTKTSAWAATAPIRQLGFTWTQVDGTADEWKDIKVEVRCYSEAANKGDFQTVSISARPKVVEFISVTSCIDKLVSKAEIRLTQEGAASTSLMGIKMIQLTAFQ